MFIGSLFKTFWASPKIKKVAGGVLIILGLIALLTPFTPGSWFVFIGLEFLGIRILFRHKLVGWLRKKT